MPTILIIDDDPDFVDATRMVLEKEGYAVISSPGGKDGIQKAMDQKPDLIILDVMMPGEGGPQTYCSLKADRQLADTPVIMLSGVKKDLFLHYLKMLNAGTGGRISRPAAYFEKPVKHADLIAAIHAVLEPDP